MAFRTHMPEALAAAREAAARGEVPVGAVLVAPDGRVVAADGNRTLELSDPTAHAEILVLRRGCAEAGSPRLPGYRLWVTLEPCPMCAAAISAARIAVLYYGAPDPRMGGVAHGARVFDHPQCHHRPEVHAGIGEAGSAALLRQFFAARRAGPARGLPEVGGDPTSAADHRQTGSSPMPTLPLLSAAAIAAATAAAPPGAPVACLAAEASGPQGPAAAEALCAALAAALDGRVAPADGPPLLAEVGRIDAIGLTARLGWHEGGAVRWGPEVESTRMDRATPAPGEFADLAAALLRVTPLPAGLLR